MATYTTYRHDKIKMEGELVFNDIRTFANDDATPDVGTIGADYSTNGVNFCLTATGNSGALDVTNLGGGVAGQMVIIIGAANANATTFKDGGHLLINGDWVEAAERTLTLIRHGADWYEISRR